jgi:hypothetical protein
LLRVTHRVDLPIWARWTHFVPWIELTTSHIVARRPTETHLQSSNTHTLLQFPLGVMQREARGLWRSRKWDTLLVEFPPSSLPHLREYPRQRASRLTERNISCILHLWWYYSIYAGQRLAIYMMKIWTVETVLFHVSPALLKWVQRRQEIHSKVTAAIILICSTLLTCTQL